MQSSPSSWKPWAAAVLSAVLLELPFPLAGPMPPWRTVFAWFALVPAACGPYSRFQAPAAAHPLRCAFFIAYLCGFLWYMGNCYWVRDTMMHYGDMPPLAPALLLIGFSLVLGLYFGLFGLGIALVRRATGSTRLALAFAPILWAALDLAAARITSVPWDQLGYSQVDNALVNQLAPWTGVYGISFVLVAVNALLAGGLLLGSESKRRLAGRWAWAGCGALLLVFRFLRHFCLAAQTRADGDSRADPAQSRRGRSERLGKPGEWDSHIAEFTQLAGEQCKTYIAGIPQTGAPTGEIICPPYPTHPDLVVWPESPAPFDQTDPRFQRRMATIAALCTRRWWWAASAGPRRARPGVALLQLRDGRRTPTGKAWAATTKSISSPSASTFPSRICSPSPTSSPAGFRPFRAAASARSFCSIRKTAEAIATASSSATRRSLPTRCASLRAMGAEVLVNISDDGWYGDTSAPWQHLNMARMRAIENRRWILRDTNNGVTAVIDPYGRVRQSIPRHQTDALPAEFGFRNDITFYTRPRRRVCVAVCLC